MLSGAVVKSATVVLISALVVFTIAGAKLVVEVESIPGFVPIPDLVISSPPPKEVKKYCNSTVELEIYARVNIDSPSVTSISYSLDGKQLVALENLTFTRVDKVGVMDIADFAVYTATVDLENLSEGNHTVTAYAIGMSTSREFTVNSFVPVIEILSPINQTYSKGVPLVFVVSGDVESAHYYMYKFKGFFDGGYDAVYEGWFTKNTTIAGLSSGCYVIYLYATTTNGEAVPTAVYFSFSKDYLEILLKSISPGILAIAIVLVMVIYFKKFKNRAKQYRAGKFFSMDW